MTAARVSPRSRTDATRTLPVLLARVLALVLVLMGFVVLAGCRGGGTEEPASEPNQPAAAMEPVAPTEREILLYFPGPNDELLHLERRAVLPIGAPEDRAKQCLEELIRGPKPPLLAAIPDGARMRQIYLLADGTAFVDFSAEMLAHRGGSLGELQTIYAIIDTLAANVPEIRRVGILVDGKARETLAGHVDIAQPLRADYQYVDLAARPAGAMDGSAPSAKTEEATPGAATGRTPGGAGEGREEGEKKQEGSKAPGASGAGAGGDAGRGAGGGSGATGDGNATSGKGRAAAAAGAENTA